jgi:hypothetical protein
MDLVDMLRWWSMRLGAVVRSWFATRLLGLGLGWSFGEGGGLSLAGALLLFEQAGEALDLGFQFGDAALQRQATGTCGLVHAGKIAKCHTYSCASEKNAASRWLTR